MGKIVVFAVAVLAAVSVIAATAIGCSNNKSSTTSSASAASSSSATPSSTSVSATAAPGDYSALLIQATDIDFPGETFTAMPATPNPNGQAGVSGGFTNAAGNRIIGDTILILPDASAAATALEGAKGALGSTVTGTPQAAPVGTGGTLVSGTSPDGSKAVTVLLFTEGKAFATLEFDSAPSDPVPPEFATGVAQKQDSAIKNGLPA
jgi:hypothetical protein